tara:strand:+ start:374 stop:535 length:162 start_codon:yes stop_codon:yes gene_type:complete
MIMPRISGKDAEGLMNAYAKVHAPKEEPQIEEPTLTTSDGINIDPVDTGYADS